MRSKEINLVITGLVFSALFLNGNAFAQTYSAWLSAGDKAMSGSKYAEAIEYYSKAIEFETEDIRLYFKMAQACRFYNDYARASAWYQKTHLADEENVLPEALFYLGEMKKYLGLYEETEKYYNIYLATEPPDSAFTTIKARSELELMNESKRIASATDSSSRITNAGTQINTVYSDFSPAITGDSVLYFSSLRFRYDPPGSKRGETKFVSRILRSDTENKKFSRPASLFMTINEPSLHNCNIAISPDHRFMVFTRCDVIEGRGLRCDLYLSKYRDGRWNKPEKLPEPFNDSIYTNTQPAISAIGAEGYHLYFASDRPGGFGKLDIWRLSIDAGYDYSDLVNLGENINTFDDDLTPWYNTGTRRLYFSSYGHANMGGYDIFSSDHSSGEYLSPVNIGPPFNSSVNDLYYSQSTDSASGFITSNRIGSMYIKSKTCCYDIYTFETVSLAEQPVASIDTTSQLKNVDSVENPLERATYDDFLPLILYFENDRPGRKSLAITTDRNYSELYHEYMNKFNEYVKGHSDGLSGLEKEGAISAVEYFFREKVQASYEKLLSFTEKVHAALEKGAHVSITVRGQASPLADTKYNVNLSKRRVASLVNYFNVYKDAALVSFIQQEKLVIEEVAAGESLSAKSVSDNYYDKRNSVYSPEASLERLIEVIDISIDLPD